MYLQEIGSCPYSVTLRNEAPKNIYPSTNIPIDTTARSYNGLSAQKAKRPPTVGAQLLLLK
jgi:hypothetical protein